MFTTIASPVKSIRRHVNTLNMFLSRPASGDEPDFESQSTSPDKVSAVACRLIHNISNPWQQIEPPADSVVAEKTNQTVGSLSSYDPRSGVNSTVKSSISGSSSYTAGRAVLPQDTTRSHGPSKLRATESATPILGDRISTRTTRLSRSQNFARNPGSVAFVSPVGRKAQAPTEKKVKPKRSLRDIFLKRDNKQSEKPQPILEHKRSFMTETRSTLAKHLRETKSLSKLQLSRAQESKSILRPARQPSLAPAKPDADATIRDANRQAALSSLEAASSSPAQHVANGAQFDTEKVVNKIINSVMMMPSEAPDRLGGLEVAEVCSYPFLSSIA